MSDTLEVSPFWRRAPWAVAVVMALGMAFQARFMIAVDTQATPCLNARVLLVDKGRRTPSLGRLMAFRAPARLASVYPEGTLMAKYVVAGPGDVVAIDADEGIYVNGALKAQGLPHWQAAPEKKPHRTVSHRLAPKHYWVLGEHPWSLDSRYWGAVREEDFVGRAYVLW